MNPKEMFGPKWIAKIWSITCFDLRKKQNAKFLVLQTVESDLLFTFQVQTCHQMCAKHFDVFDVSGAKAAHDLSLHSHRPMKTQPLFQLQLNIPKKQSNDLTSFANRHNAVSIASSLRCPLVWAESSRAWGKLIYRHIYRSDYRNLSNHILAIDAVQCAFRLPYALL